MITNVSVTITSGADCERCNGVVCSPDPDDDPFTFDDLYDSDMFDMCTCIATLPQHRAEFMDFRDDMTQISAGEGGLYFIRTQTLSPTQIVYKIGSAMSLKGVMGRYATYLWEAEFLGAVVMNGVTESYLRQVERGVQVCG
jgi:hypothetical protein